MAAWAIKGAPPLYYCGGGGALRGESFRSDDGGEATRSLFRFSRA